MLFPNSQKTGGNCLTLLHHFTGGDNSDSSDRQGSSPSHIMDQSQDRKANLRGSVSKTSASPLMLGQSHITGLNLICSSFSGEFCFRPPSLSLLYVCYTHQAFCWQSWLMKIPFERRRHGHRYGKIGVGLILIWMVHHLFFGSRTILLTISMVQSNTGRHDLMPYPVLHNVHPP